MLLDGLTAYLCCNRNVGMYRFRLDSRENMLIVSCSFMFILFL